jgi:phage terminase large subunit-like protein
VLAEVKPVDLIGSPLPRLAPPMPLRHDLVGYRRAAASLGITPMPWQETAATYLTATDADGNWLYREVAIVVGRQNGKTTLTKPLIVMRLRDDGRKEMHIAQVRELPRIMFEAIADALEAEAPELFPRRRGKVIWPRRGAGSESILLTNGGAYRIAAATSGAARGHDAIDDLIIDELREMESWEVINAAQPAQRFSSNPQTIYLSNAGTDDSVVLNSLRVRAEAGDPSLAYLEWSADPEYDPSDVRGWVQANPSIGHFPQVLRDLEKSYLSAELAGNMAGFETEALCRWVKTMRPSLVSPEEWAACEAEGKLPRPRRSHMAVSMDPDRARASAATAWLGADGVCYLSVLDDVSGSPIRTSLIGKEWRDAAVAHHVPKVAYDPLTDAELAKFFKATKPISGMEFANATSNFVELVRDGRLRWVDAEAVGTDLGWTARKENDETGSYQAVRANDDRPITAVLASIRAVWLATGLRLARPRVY